MLIRESCAGCREVVGEALTAARLDRILSVVNPIRGAENIAKVESNTGGTAMDEGRPVNTTEVNARVGE